MSRLHVVLLVLLGTVYGTRAQYEDYDDFDYTIQGYEEDYDYHEEDEDDEEGPGGSEDFDGDGISDLEDGDIDNDGVPDDEDTELTSEKNTNSENSIESYVVDDEERDDVDVRKEGEEGEAAEGEEGVEEREEEEEEEEENPIIFNSYNLLLLSNQRHVGYIEDWFNEPVETMNVFSFDSFPIHLEKTKCLIQIEVRSSF